MRANPARPSAHAPRVLHAQYERFYEFQKEWVETGKLTMIYDARNRTKTPYVYRSLMATDVNSERQLVVE